MAHAVWNGTVQFGLVSIPVKMNTAVSDNAPKFNQINSKTGNRVSQKRVDSVTGDEVPYDDIVKGKEVAKDMYVTISPEELTALDPVGSRTIDLDTFVDPAEINPLLFDSPYYLVPDKNAEKPYHLLREALAKTGKAAVGTFVMRSKQYVTCIWPTGEGLAMTTLHWSDELRPIENVPIVELSDKELEMASALIESLAGTFDPTAYTDEYRNKVNELIEAKAKGEELTPVREVPTVAMGDLMATLEASMAQFKDKKKEEKKAQTA